MSNPNPKTDQLIPTQWPSGTSGNPAGKAKGTKHLSTYIQEIMEDENFSADYIDGYMIKTYKGAPVKALLRVAIIKSLAGDRGWAEWLAKYGYGSKVDTTYMHREHVVPILSGITKDHMKFKNNIVELKREYNIG